MYDFRCCDGSDSGATVVAKTVADGVGVAERSVGALQRQWRGSADCWEYKRTASRTSFSTFCQILTAWSMAETRRRASAALNRNLRTVTNRDGDEDC